MEEASFELRTRRGAVENSGDRSYIPSDCSLFIKASKKQSFDIKAQVPNK